MTVRRHLENQIFKMKRRKSRVRPEKQCDERSMENFDLFEMLGISLPKAEEKAETAKKAAKKETTKTQKNTEKKAEKLKFPVTVFTGVCAPMVLTAENAGGLDTLDKVKKHVCEQKGWPEQIVVAVQLSADRIAVCLDFAKAKAKGEFTISESTVIVCGEEEYSAASIAGERTLKEVRDFLVSQTGDEYADWRFIEGGNGKIYASIGVGVAHGERTLPIRIKSSIGEMVLTRDDFDDMEEEGEIDVDDVAEKVFSSEMFSNMEPCLALFSPAKPKEDESLLYVGVKAIVATVKKPEPTKTMYPTNAVISMIFNRIQLSPEMFGGAEKVDEKAIISVLNKDYPEYTEARTRLTYDKDGNFIFPTLKSSAKGVDVYDSREECMEAAEGKEYFLASYTDKDLGNRLYRYEKTFVSETEACQDESIGRFHWKLPQIPSTMYEAIKMFFRNVNKYYETEALVWLVWDDTAKKYAVVVPEQSVSKVSVQTEAELLSVHRVVKVADIHSHNEKDAFFSSIDDADEKGNCLYGVMGRFDMPEPKQLFRAGTGGKYVWVDINRLLTDDLDEEEAEVLAEFLYDEWYREVTFLN